MRYKPRINSVMSRDEIEKKLRNSYGFSLLNFAYVIANVLAENTFFSKSMGGKRLTDFKDERDSLVRLKNRIMEMIDDHMRKFEPSLSGKSFSTNRRVNFYVSKFALEPFFAVIDNRIKYLEEMIKLFKNKPEVGFLPWPEAVMGTKPFGYANQISFLWAQVLQSNESPHWINISELLTWFLQKLEDATYTSRMEGGSSARRLGKQYSRIKQPYSFILAMSQIVLYFPYKNEKPRRFLEEIDVKTYKIGDGCPVISVKFYTNKVKTIFEKTGIQKKEVTVLEKDKPETYIEDYHPDEEKVETSKLLLEFD